jgi:hypothetical protein
MSMDQRIDVIKACSRRLYGLAVLLYLVSLASRTVAEQLAYLPAVESYSRPLAGVLRFAVSELQMLTAPPVAALCLILAFILRPTLTSLLGGLRAGAAREDGSAAHEDGTPS